MGILPIFVQHKKNSNLSLFDELKSWHYIHQIWNTYLCKLPPAPVKKQKAEHINFDNIFIVSKHQQQGVQT